MSTDSLATILHDLYYDASHPAGYRGVNALLRHARKRRPNTTLQEVKAWLRTQDPYTLHKPSRKRYSRNRIYVKGIDDQWQADLVDVRQLSRQNRGFKYLLTCIDIFSKYAWVIPLKDKTGTSLKRAFLDILKDGRQPRKLQTDKGSEFFNRQVKNLLIEKDIHLFATHNETKASVVERFNRTLKEKMWKYFTANHTMAYLNVLPKLVTSYNSAHHRSIGRSPNSVTLKNELDVWRTLYPRQTSQQPQVFRFDVGDKVRLSMTVRPFRKGYLPRWTEEIFTVSARLPRRPPVYRIKDWDGEVIHGTFYETEIQRVDKHDKDVYRVERVLRRRRKQDGKMEYFVKWTGYPSKFNSWTDQLINL